MARLGWTAYLAAHLPGQARLPFQPPATIEQVQNRRVRRMVAFAYRTVPFYREALERLRLSPSDLRTASDLARLPIVERHDLQRSPMAFVSSTARVDRCLQIRTGGSTGVPCTVYHDTAALFQNAGHGERERSMITALVGRSFGYRETVIGSPTVTDRVVQEYCRTRALFPSGIRIERQYLSLVDPPEVNLERINGFRPDVIRSYGSYLEALFPFAWSSGRAFHRPKVVVYSSDAVTPSVRRLIVERCEIPLLSTYEAVEAFKIGFECRVSRGIHLNVDLYPIRIVNAKGETLAPGERGEVVVSNLVNRGTVLLNYRLGDLATMLDERCPCGRYLPLLSFPEGRSDEYLNLPDGRVLHPQAVRTVLVAEEDIWQFQVVQRTPADVLVAIVPSAPPTAALRRRLAERLDAVFGPLVRVEIVFVEAIDGALSGGKRRAVVSLGQSAVAERTAYS